MTSFWISIILGTGLGAVWMATGWDSQDERFLRRLVNWLMLIGLFFDLIWMVWIVTGVGFQNLALIGIGLLIMGWTVLKDWNTPRDY